ncbi:gelsolin-like protein 1 [Actinia tenebrosa]|uniref:Gelsolin-like protein 1 n=1 Tax=Actinia tenebrosa TaxID=6105 RepID=A0A6P8I8P5_ACTTE|nr:gelsolin-like protein 1 [Actinia tenebrosa]
MRKAKQYDWKDSNLALFGSDTEKNVKKESAQTEKAWKGAGSKLGLQIWRIKKFKVTDVPKEEYGSFYNGDSYILLNTYKKDPDSMAFDYDVHFWIGKFSTQDEYGTAAYKTVELDTLLDDKPIQHREVEGHESALFKSYFKSLTYWKGGADSGFRCVEPTSYEPRLLHVHGTKKKIECKEIPFCMDNLTKDDVFVIDLGLKIFQWNGDDANKDERYSAGQYIRVLKSERSGKPEVIVLDDQTLDDVPEELLEVIPKSSNEDPDEDLEDPDPKEKVLFQLSDRTGSLQFNEIARGTAVKRNLLKNDDVFILDTGSHCYVWTGPQASIDERRNAMTYAHNYLSSTKHPLLPVTCIKGGAESNEFNKAF